MTPDQLRELRRLLAEATRTDKPECNCIGDEFECCAVECAERQWYYERSLANVAVRDALVTSAPELLDAVERLTRERDRERAEVERLTEEGREFIERLTRERDSYRASMELAVSRLVGVSTAVGGEWDSPEGLPEAVAKLRTDRDRAIADRDSVEVDLLTRAQHAERERDEARRHEAKYTAWYEDQRQRAVKAEQERDEARAVLRDCRPLIGAASPLKLDGLRARIDRALGGG